MIETKREIRELKASHTREQSEMLIKFFDLLGNKLDDRFYNEPNKICAHNFKTSLEVIEEIKGDRNFIINTVKQLGGTCDCEVMCNAYLLYVGE